TVQVLIVRADQHSGAAGALAPRGYRFGVREEIGGRDNLAAGLKRPTRRPSGGVQAVECALGIAGEKESAVHGRRGLDPAADLRLPYLAAVRQAQGEDDA